MFRGSAVRASAVKNSLRLAAGAFELQSMAETGVEEPNPSGPVSFGDVGIPRLPKLMNTLLGKVKTAALIRYCILDACLLTECCFVLCGT